MSDFSVHGKRFYPEPTVSFPRLEKPTSPVRFTLPALTCPLDSQPLPTPPHVMHLSTVPRQTTSLSNGSNVPLPNIPRFSNYMHNNRVSLDDISGNITSEGFLRLCRSSKDLIEMSKQFSDELSIEQISRICDVRDKVFERGGAYVFTPEQFVQFYGFYNMFLTEERSWEPRLSEKFYNSSRTRLRCSCRWTPRLNKRARTAGETKTQHKCSAVYDMSYWPMHRLVIWECSEAPNHPMNVNAAFLNCQYVENLVRKMGVFNPQDIVSIIKNQLEPLSSRLFLESLDYDRVRTLVRGREEPSKSRGPRLGVDIQLAQKHTTMFFSRDIYTRTVNICGGADALIVLHKDVFRSIFYSETIDIKINYRVSLHLDKVSAISLSGSDGRCGATVFMPICETNAAFEGALQACLGTVEQIGHELYGSYATGFVGLANTRKVNVSLIARSKPEHPDWHLSRSEARWSRALMAYKFRIADIARFDREVTDPEIRAMLKKAYQSPTVKQGEDILLESIRTCEAKNNITLESYLRTQFQYFHKWGAHKSHWAIDMKCDGTDSSELPFGLKSSLTAVAVQFAGQLLHSSQFRPKPIIRSKIALSSVLHSPPASEDNLAQ